MLAPCGDTPCKELKKTWCQQGCEPISFLYPCDTSCFDYTKNWETIPPKRQVSITACDSCDKDPQAKDRKDYPATQDAPPTEEECIELSEWSWNKCFSVTQYGEAPKGQLCGMDEEHCQSPAVCYLKHNDQHCPGATGFWWCGRCADGGG